MRAAVTLACVLVGACGGSNVSIGGDLPDAPDAPAAFDPLSISNVVLWLDAARGVTMDAGVARWADRTSHANDALQPMAALQPSLVPSAIHALPAVHFNKDAQGTTVGQELAIADAPSLQWGTGDFYLAVVARFDNSAADDPERAIGAMYSKVGNGSNFPGVFVTANIPGNLGGPAVGVSFSTSFAPNDHAMASTAYNDNSPHVFAVQRSGSGLDLRIDGASIATSVSDDVDVSSPGVVAAIGSVGNGLGTRLDGDIAEILAITGPLALADRAALEHYLASKYVP